MGSILTTCSLQAKNDETGWDSGNTGQRRETFTQNNDGGGVPGTVTVPVAGVNLDLSELGTEGWARFQNLDADNFVEHGPEVAAVFHPYGRMGPGEPACFRLSPGKTVHLKADTADCLVQVLVMED